MPRKKYRSITAYREDHDCKQAELAERLGIGQSALSMIEQGKRRPRGDLALLIHTITGVPLKALLGTRKRRVA